MSTILLKNVQLDNGRTNIFIKDKTIAKISAQVGPEMAAERTIDCSNLAAVPGLVNMHTHAAMTLMRGAQEDTPLKPWLDRIWAIERHLDDECIYWGTKLAILEMIKTGTTCFLDMYWSIPVAARAANEMGIRSLLTYVLLDGGDKAKAERQRRECEEIYAQSRDWEDRVQFGVAVHADYTVDEEGILWASRFAKDHGLKLHAHVAETEQEMFEDIYRFGVTPVMHFDKLGVIDENFIAAHMVWLNEEDIKTFGRRGATAVHNVNSNMKLSSGYKFKYDALKDAGANVCIGTDGAASSNNLDLRESMKTMALLQKAWRHTPSAMPLDELMDVATVNGAKALGINAGRIEEGALADITLVNTNNEMFTPNINFRSNFIFSANSSCVDTVICDGRILMEGRRIKGEEEIIEGANRTAWKLLEKAK